MTAPSWDGRPSNPEVNGYHWLRKGPHSDARPFIADWHGPLFVQGEWSLGGVWYTPKAVALLWSYLGPVAPYQPATADAGGQATPHPDVAQAVAGDADWWVIRKNAFFYRPNSQGYTKRIDEAGRYTEAEARAHKHHADEVVIMPLVEARAKFPGAPDIAQAVADERERAEKIYANLTEERSKSAALRQQLRATPRPGASVEGLRALSEAATLALNFIQNTESELGITLACGNALRAALVEPSTSDWLETHKDYAVVGTTHDGVKILQPKEPPTALLMGMVGKPAEYEAFCAWWRHREDLAAQAERGEDGR